MRTFEPHFNPSFHLMAFKVPAFMSPLCIGPRLLLELFTCHTQFHTFMFVLAGAYLARTNEIPSIRHPSLSVEM
jgi:hypothetical protein